MGNKRRDIPGGQIMPRTMWLTLLLILDSMAREALTWLEASVLEQSCEEVFHT